MDQKRQPKLGTGERFSKLKNHLSHQPGINDPAALAASIGRKRLGAKKMTDLALKGKKVT